MKKIKSKVFAGLAFLFVVIILLSVIGIVFINQLANASKGTLADNYRSVEYTMSMLKSLDRIYDYKTHHMTISQENASDEMTEKHYVTEKNNFLSSLTAEKKNVTEPGEKEIVDELNNNYSNFIYVIEQKENNTSLINVRNSYFITRQSIVDIYNINMSAIQKINSRIEDTAHRVSLWLIIIDALSILITLFFIIKYPGSIVDPILELTDKIKAISKGNYDQQLNFTSKDELGDLAAAFNIMAGRLKEYDESNLDKLLIEKKRLDAIIENLQDAVFLLDENKNFLMANRGALSLTGLRSKDISGKYAPDVAMNNDLLRELIKGLIKNGNEKNTDDEKPIKIIQNKKEYYYSREIIKKNSKPKRNNINKTIEYIFLLKNFPFLEKRDV